MTNFGVPEEIQILSAQRSRAFSNLVTLPAPEKAIPGQIWSTYASLDLPIGEHIETTNPRMIMILDDMDDVFLPGSYLTAVPISVDLEMASSDDLLIKGDNSPLHFDFMVEVWNETPILRAHLKQYLGQLNSYLTTLLEKIYNAHLENRSLEDGLEDYIGSPIFDTADLRLEFQQLEIASVKYLSEAATMTMDYALQQVSVEELDASAIPVQTLGDLINAEDPNLPSLPEESFKRLSMDSTPVEALLDPASRNALLGPALRQAKVPPTLLGELILWVNGTIAALIHSNNPAIPGLLYMRQQKKPKEPKH